VAGHPTLRVKKLPSFQLIPNFVPESAQVASFFSELVSQFERSPVGAFFRDPLLKKPSNVGLQSAAASADQVEDQDDQREHQQQVNESTSDVEAEAQKPQNQNDDKNCPEHVYLSFALRAPELGKSRSGAPSIFHKLWLIRRDGLRLRASDCIEKRVCRRGRRNIAVQNAVG
jgi:hypothetical protein